MKALKKSGWIILFFLATACLDTDEGITPLEQLNRDIATIDKYLLDNGITTAIKDASGIRIVIDELGTEGLPPNMGNDIVVNYTGRLLSNNFQFDEGTVDERLPNYILGWQIGLGLLPEGSIATLYIPSVYGYGPNGTGSIPGNSILVFDVELESVSETPQQTTRRQADIQLIDDYLEEKEISAIQHESGIRYTLTEGTGISFPTLYDQVEIEYTGRLLSDGSVFYSESLKPSDEFSSRVINFPHGVLIGLQLMKEGDKMVIYTPSTLAYGTQSYTGVPANSNIIFEVELVKIH